MAVALKQITSVVMSVNGLKQLCASNTSLVLEQSAQHRAQAQEALQIYTAHEQNAMAKQHENQPHWEMESYAHLSYQRKT